MKNIVICKTPLRISLFGGGTDFKNHFIKNPSSVISFTINQYIYIVLKKHNNKLFNEKYRLNYSSVENIRNVQNIKNKIIKNTILFKKINDPLYVSTISDVPGGTGLGSSSAFTVGLLNAINKLQNRNSSKKKLAEEAAHIEIKMCKSPIGYQDQYAVSYGGINKINFNNKKIYVKNLSKYESKINSLINNSICLWVGNTRKANNVLKIQKKK